MHRTAKDVNGLLNEFLSKDRLLALKFPNLRLAAEDTSVSQHLQHKLSSVGVFSSL